MSMLRATFVGHTLSLSWSGAPSCALVLYNADASQNRTMAGAQGRGVSVVVVQVELIGMRPQPERIDLVLALVIDPRPNEIVREHLASCEKRVILLERLQGLFERTRRLSRAFQLLSRHLVD